MRFRSLLTALFALVLLFVATPARAQAVRTWVSGVGDDVNPCSRTAPCRTFAGAISKTAAGGIINALDPGAYGAVTITKALTIEARGVTAGVLHTGTNGITVNAGPNDVVVLRGLSLHGGNTGGNYGIRFLAGKALHVEDTTIQATLVAAIDFQPATAAALFLKRVTVTGNTGEGVLVGGGSSATLTQCAVSTNTVGLHAVGAAKVSVHDSVFANHTEKGVFAEGTAEINLDHGLITGNLIGVQGDSTVRLAEVMVSHNGTGLAGAKVTSYGNNRVAAGNGANGAPTETLPQQ